MRQRKRKSKAPAAGNLIKGIWRDEIVADVFELWIGISRLMARMRGSQPQFEIAAPKRLPDKKPAAARRRKAA